jgi:hypothetical protein
MLFLTYCRHWISFRHFGPVARSVRTGYVLRCSDEEAVRTLIVDAPHFERI